MKRYPVLHCTMGKVAPAKYADIDRLIDSMTEAQRALFPSLLADFDKVKRALRQYERYARK